MRSDILSLVILAVLMALLVFACSSPRASAVDPVRTIGAPVEVWSSYAQPAPGVVGVILRPNPSQVCGCVLLPDGPVCQCATSFEKGTAEEGDLEARRRDRPPEPGAG